MVFFLSGCQTDIVKNQKNNNTKNNPVIAVVSAQQQILGFEGVINSSTNLHYSEIRTVLDRVSVSWHGDAVELLSHLAKRKGYKFVWTGIRLPLPVNLNVEGVAYRNLIRLIRLQIAWRAELHEHPGQLTLVFNPQELKKAKED